jgi:NAD(P) transhydrogenase
MAERYDLVVIGSGPAGEKGAAQAAYFGKRVALVERAPHLGGAAINTGTIPSKTLRETALYFSGLRQRGLYGIDYSLKENLTAADLLFRERAVVETERNLVARNLERHHVDVYWGEGSFVDEHTVAVCGAAGEATTLSAEVVLLATGSSPYHPPNVPFDSRLVHDSDSILRIERIPRSLAVIGGGVIGCEYAAIFTALGVNVTLVDRRNRLLPFVDAEIARRLQDQLERLGLHYLFERDLLAVETAADQVHLTLGDGGRLTCDMALFATGRTSNVEGLGLERIGVRLGERGLILVNEKYQTSVPHIYAAGDVIGFPALVSTSMEQARVAMVHAFDLRYKQRLSPVVPLAIYTVPEIAMAGLTSDECEARGIPYLAGRAYYESNARGQIVGDMSGMLKIVFSPEDKRVLGVHHIGEMASELVHTGADVIAAGGTIDTFIDAVYNFPSLSDLYKYAAYDVLDAWHRWKSEFRTGDDRPR